MLSTDQDEFFEQILFRALGTSVSLKRFEFLSGGCINMAVRLDTEEGSFFLKWNESKAPIFFEKEAQGLEQLAATGTFRVPRVGGFGEIAGKSYLLLEYFNERYKSAQFFENLGRQLAALHRHTSKNFGLTEDNYIGALEQQNNPSTNWHEFFIEKRLRPQAGLAYYNGLISLELLKRFDLLYDKIPQLLPTEAPSLLHGDLWSGNVMATSIDIPCLIDPAIYYGNREVEIAFTQLFGGFGANFYQSYELHFPMEKGFEKRKDIYNLYPLLVHTNLFGKSYLQGVTKVLDYFVG
ncbi:MAG: fructosamine kinase family protein [Bernardetiaceae bacterium]|nr:fructosamine kinase family protein [Bernardetiaceae bacterium]